MYKTTGSADLRASLQELMRAGSPVDLSVADSDRENAKLEITQVGGIHDSSIFELPDGRAGCRIVLLITNQTSGAIYTPEVELRTSSWEDDFFQWLEPLRISVRNSRKPDTSYQVYRFPGPSGLELQYDAVLNHILLEDQSVAPGRPFEGFLLALGRRMPAELRHGQFIDVTLAIIGSDHTEYTQSICLWTERLESRPKAMVRRSNLFGEPLNTNARDSVRVPSLESRMHADPDHLQESQGDRGALGAGKAGPRLWQQFERFTQTLLGDSETQQGIFHLCARLIDSGGVRVVLRSLHADFEIAVAQLGDADDDKHRLTFMTPW